MGGMQCFCSMLGVHSVEKLKKCEKTPFSNFFSKNVDGKMLIFTEKRDYVFKYFSTLWGITI